MEPINIGAERREMKVMVDRGFYAHLDDVTKIQSGFALGGGAIGFFYAVYYRKPSVIQYVLLGLVLGGLIGFFTRKIIKGEATLAKL